MYRMIAIDVDDTLLNDEREITEGTRHALAEAVRRGVVVTLATGRMYASARNVAKQLELNVPLITYQGSLVRNLMDGVTLYERAVPAEEAERLFQYSEQHGLHIQAYCDDILYAQEDNDKVRAYAELSKVPYRIERDFSKLLGGSLTKLLFIDEPDFLNRLSPELAELTGGRVHLTKSKPNFLEVIHPEGTKGHALRYLAGHYGCGPEQVIAIGDSWNDKEMLEMAGLGVAMANAVDSLKSVANYVTLSNNEEGVRHVVEKFILGSD